MSDRATQATSDAWLAAYDQLADDELRARMATLYPDSRLHERGVAHGIAYTIIMDSPDEGRVLVDDHCLSAFQRIAPDQWADAGPYRPSRSAVAHAAIRAALDDLDEYPPSLLRLALRKAR